MGELTWMEAVSSWVVCPECGSTEAEATYEKYSVWFHCDCGNSQMVYEE